MFSASAPGKIILFGEHAVVYGRPAIAIPLSQLRATAVVASATQPGIRLIAPDLGQNVLLADAPPDDPIAAVIREVQTAVGQSNLPDITITVSSQIPIASGLGSGAAITAAVVRALAEFLGLAHLATPAWVSALTYEVEKIHHGTPSGIDNTVVAYEMPVYFVRQQPQNHIEPFTVARPLHLLVADTGVRSSTKIAVGDVRRQWQEHPAKFEALFDGCGRIAQAARAAIETGDVAALGPLMQENHALLQEMTVSSPELDRLVTAAIAAGALGAKLSGAGRGGNMIALVTPATATAVHHALLTAGAKNVLATTLA
ncbi:MAG: mevalonate kinase [Chloroflexi bacterium]|nr:mevalonate kinase [Ardenticatenaceae bacterium]MBL1130323.1 mevalonate kinase [Chloroflexota bacterium]NOG36414.1 mevalonate kinase [Chloroflexota bacterium]GIK57822.1 MAG: mevalonate kinase [Chloroflexota bacterium]